MPQELSNDNTAKLAMMRLAFWGALMGFLYRLAPGEKTSWMDQHNYVSQVLLEHPLPPIGKDVGYSIQRFLGGDDGTTKLVGRLYSPSNSNAVRTNENKPSSSQLPPVVVMAHGLGLTQDCRLEPFVKAFRDAGLAVFTFDYSTFGWSEGWPRHEAIPQRHVADLHAALAHVRHNLSQVVDIHRIALWGTSLGGGHVLSVAAVDSGVKAVVAQVPHIKSGLEAVLGSLWRDPYRASMGLLQVSGALLKWAITKVTGLVSDKYKTPVYIPLHGLPGSSAMLQNPGDDEGYGRLVNHLSSFVGWRNLVSVSSVIPILLYRPLNVVHHISCPTMFIPAELDTLCPAADSEEAVLRLRKVHFSDGNVEDNNNKNHGKRTTARLRMMRGLSHFDVYREEALGVILKETASFLTEQLMVVRADASAL